MFIESIEYKGYTIKIIPDDDSESPRDWDNLGIMVCQHKKYNLGDTDHEINLDNCRCWDDVVNAIRMQDGFSLIPLYMLDHSGLAIRAGQGFSDVDSHGWDWGQIGFIFTTHEKLKELFPVDFDEPDVLKTIESELMREVEVYNTFISGEVVGYTIEIEDEIVDSCWSFYSVTDAIKEAKSVVDYKIETGE